MRRLIFIVASTLIRERDTQIAVTATRTHASSAAEKFRRGLNFFLDSLSRNFYTFVSCFIRMKATSMSLHRDGSAGKRNQAKQQTKATHTGSANIALPGVFLAFVHACFTSMCILGNV